jgi:hypothetical protein
MAASVARFTIHNSRRPSPREVFLAIDLARGRRCAGQEENKLKPLIKLGDHFGRLTVAESLGSKLMNGKRRSLWRCTCECGGEATTITASLRNGTTRSCGCLRGSAHFKRATNQNDEVLPTKDLRGKVFGRLRVMKFDGYRRFKGGQNRPNGASRGMWLCQCECGNTTIVETSSLTTGNAKSCGCLQRHRASEAKTGTIPKSRLRLGESEMRRTFRNCRRTALKKGFAFELDVETFHRITRSNCHYCGAEPAGFSKTGRAFGPYVHNGIDRVNNNLGYLMSNCVRPNVTWMSPLFYAGRGPSR